LPDHCFNKQKLINIFAYFCAVAANINILKGLHPGLYLDREIRARGLKKNKLALDCREYPQTLNAILKGKRDMNTALSLKLEQQLGLEEGMLMTLQVFYNIREEKKKQSGNRPNLELFRKSLFWDTTMETLNWQDHYRFIIERVFERGNEAEKKVITDFYGSALINEVLQNKPHKSKRKRL
jgi:antitoxin HigA-1